MRRTVTEDFRTMDPVAYIGSVGLKPEDSYGFIPTKLDEGATALFLYRDRPEYEAARPTLAAPEEATRLVPGIRMRSSLRQLNHFLPKYVETVGLRPEDTYGVFPWGTRSTAGGEAGTGGLAWDDYWIVYRDRPEYEAARDAYADEADKKGRWPDPVISPGVGEAPAVGPEVEKLKVEKEGWPRKALVVKETGPELAEEIEGKISKFGYEPEDSFGFCPNFEHNRIYFGWRKR